LCVGAWHVSREQKAVSHETLALGARSNGPYKGGAKRFDHEETRIRPECGSPYIPMTAHARSCERSSCMFEVAVSLRTNYRRLAP